MNKILENLLETISSSDSVSQNKAITQLSDLLDKSNKRYYPAVDFSDFLSPELLALELPESEQKDIVEAISKIIVTQPNNGSLYWLIGKATPRAAIGSLLMLLNRYGENFNETTAYQAIIALENCFLNVNEEAFSEIVRYFYAKKPVMFFKKMLTADDTRVAAIALRILDMTKNIS